MHGNTGGKELKLGATDISFEALKKLFMKMVAENGVICIRSDKELKYFTKQKLSLEAKRINKDICQDRKYCCRGAKEGIFTLFAWGFRW